MTDFLGAPGDSLQNYLVWVGIPRRSLKNLIIMGSSISRIEDEYHSYCRLCEELGEDPKDYEDVYKHTKELVKKYNLIAPWWCPNCDK